MKRNVLNFGLILGAILCVNIVYTVHLCYSNPDFKSNNIVGYVAIVINFSLIFFGIRNYRSKNFYGKISFGNALKTGALIALVGSTIYVLFWLFYYYLFVPDFLDKYISHVLKETAQNRIADLAAKTIEMAKFKERYKNPLFVILITYLEVLPVGLIVALVSSLILRNDVRRRVKTKMNKLRKLK